MHGPGTFRTHSRSKGENSGSNGASGKSAKAMSGCARYKPLARAPPTSMWVHVGDPRADMFPFFQACRSTQTHFLVRAGKSRRTLQNEDEISYELPQARSWPSQASRPFEVPARHGHPGRSTHLQLACGQLTLLPPRARATSKQGAFDRVGHARLGRAGSPRGEEPLEWLLMTSVPTTTLEHAWERVGWYGLVSVSVARRGLSPLSEKWVSHRRAAIANG
jgi:hypothetical protein